MKIKQIDTRIPSIFSKFCCVVTGIEYKSCAQVSCRVPHFPLGRGIFPGYAGRELLPGSFLASPGPDIRGAAQSVERDSVMVFSTAGKMAFLSISTF